MLYLMRKQDESIIINNEIELKVVEIKGKSVKLGFTFPKGASVLRKELYDKIKQENIAAASSNDTLSIDAVEKLEKLTLNKPTEVEPQEPDTQAGDNTPTTSHE